MQRKATAIAPSNIALIKYWGLRNEALLVPHNASISMTLTHARTRTTVEYDPEGEGTEVWLTEDGAAASAPDGFRQPVVAHVEKIRERLGIVRGGFRVQTENTFPAAAGLASSASGFAALAVATCGALGHHLGQREGPGFALLGGSGSAARSLAGGYVQWPSRGLRDQIEVVAPFDHWTLCDVIAVVNAEPKDVSSLEGHKRASSSSHFARRLELLPARTEIVRRAILQKDFERLIKAVEEEAMELHLIAMSAKPRIIYWKPGTLDVLARVEELRDGGVPCCFTMDAGPNVHVLCEPDQEQAVVDALDDLGVVERVIRDRTGPGARFLDESAASS